MSYKFEGSKYQATKNLDVKEIAKLIRQEIKATFSNDWKFSVRIDRFANGQSIRTNITQLPTEVKLYSDETNHWGGKEYSKEITDAINKVKMMSSKYNYDDSDMMVDYYNVKFYNHIGVDWRLVKKLKDSN
jgi:hypothetical protein